MTGLWGRGLGVAGGRRPLRVVCGPGARRDGGATGRMPARMGPGRLRGWRFGTGAPTGGRIVMAGPLVGPGTCRGQAPGSGDQGQAPADHPRLDLAAQVAGGPCGPATAALCPFLEQVSARMTHRPRRHGRPRHWVAIGGISCWTHAMSFPGCISPNIALFVLHRRIQGT